MDTNVATQIARIRQDRNTIREKILSFGLVESTANLDDLATAISEIENNGGVKQSVKEGESYTIPAGYHDGSGTVIGIAGGGNYSLQSKTVTPTKQQQSITADEGSYGLSDVTVNAIPAAYQDVTAVTAAATDVLATKVYVDATGKVTTGTMPNRGAVNQTLSTTNTSYSVPAGYHNGSGTVKITLQTKTATPTEDSQQIQPDSGKVLSQVTVNAIPRTYANTTDATATSDSILFGQTAYIAGTDADGVTAKAVKVSGTMPNNGATGASLDTTTTSYTIPAGYTTGGTVSIATETKTATPTTSDQNIIPTTGKVLSTVTVKGVTVTLPTASQILSGKTASVTSNGTTLGTVTGNIASKSAATYYPQPVGTGTDQGDQTIASGKYLSGTQTIKAVTTSGISASNIKHGVTINVGDARTGKEGNIATATGSFYNDGTTYTLNSVGTNIDMGETSSNRYITTSNLQVIPTAVYTATGAVSEVDITTYGKLTIASGSVTENAGVLTSGTTPTWTQGTVTATKGWITAGTKVSGATFANSATTNVTYKDISNTTAAPILKSGDYLYINKGYTDNIKISLAKLVPDAASAELLGDFILSGYSAYDNDGTLIAGSIETVSTKTYYPSTSDQTIPAKQYTGADGISIKKVTTANISAANIKYNTVVKVGDAADDDRVLSVTGTFTKESTNPIAANTVLSGKIGYVNGSKVTGTMANNGAVSMTFDPLTQTSVTIAAGYHNGSGTVNLTKDLEDALAAI